MNFYLITIKYTKIPRYKARLDLNGLYIVVSNLWIQKNYIGAKIIEHSTALNSDMVTILKQIICDKPYQLSPSVFTRKAKLFLTSPIVDNIINS